MMGLFALMLVAGCTEREKRVVFDGNYYPPKSRGDRDDRRDFTASVGRVTRGIEGAQQAVLHEARRYCVQNFGTSEIAWAQVAEGQQGPAFSRSGSRVTVRGTCVLWQ